MKFALIGSVLALFALGACDKFNEVAAKYDPDGVIRCMLLDEAEAKAAEHGVTLSDWLKTENLVVCEVK